MAHSSWLIAHSPQPTSTLLTMIETADRSLLRWAIAGDVVTLTVITVLGFATHHTLDAYWRMFVTVLVTLIAWAIVAPWFDAFSTTTLTRPSAVWKIL